MSNGITAPSPKPLHIPKAANHDALAVQPDLITAALSQATEDAYDNAHRARKVLLHSTTEYIARLIRQALPDAAVITVDTVEKELHAVLDRDGETIWFAPASPASELHDGLVDDINDLLGDAIPFGGLAGAGWKVAKRGEPYRTVLLPASPSATAVPATDARPEGAPGEDAGHCAQCDRLLIWDRSGRRVNDEYGEYFCYGPRRDTTSAVHVLAK